MLIMKVGSPYPFVHRKRSPARGKGEGWRPLGVVCQQVVYAPDARHGVDGFGDVPASHVPELHVCITCLPQRGAYNRSR